MKPATVPKPIPWPDGAATMLGCSGATLAARQALGDHPALYAVTERILVTTDVALADWLAAKPVPQGYRARAATRTSGATAAKAQRRRQSHKE